MVRVKPSDGATKIGVLDIGSNSVRLVIFQGARRMPVPIFNEKALCGLGSEIAVTGKLSKKGRLLAMDSICRFVKIAENMDLKRLHVFATAAVREAQDGKRFVEKLAEKFGYLVEILSGNREAYLSALGVISAFPKAIGMVCDLGGGSLELANVRKGEVKELASLPMGSLRFKSLTEVNREDLEQEIDKQLSTISWIKRLEGNTLFAIGGAWRSLARLSMETSSYPLRIIDGYSVSSDDIISFLRQLYPITVSTKRQVELDWQAVSSARSNQMPIASLILMRLIICGKINEVTFSASGVREGCLFDGLDGLSRSEDPLLNSCLEYVSGVNKFSLSPEELADWVFKLCPQFLKNYRRLVRAVCIIRDLAWREHPSYRAEQAFLSVLRFPVVGLAHKERVFLALAILSRYRGSVGEVAERTCIDILSLDEQKSALMLGLTIGLGLTISGGITGLLKNLTVKSDQEKITIIYPRDSALMKGKVTQRWLPQMEKVFAKQILLQPG